MDLTTLFAGTLLALAATWPTAAAAQACEPPPRIPRHVIAEAMRAHGPYSLTSTNTAMVFGSEALLAIVRQRQREAPRATQFVIDHEDWFKAHQATAGVDYAAMSEHYNPDKLSHGRNQLNGEEVFFIGNPGLGLWAHESRLA